MQRRVAFLTLQQAIRAVLISLLPLSFIALFAWATAGAQNGQTADPIRGSIWLWQGAHLIPFHVGGQSLSLLPLGALVIPIFAQRISMRRVIIEGVKPQLVTLFFALWYTVFVTLISLTANTNNVHTTWYFVALHALVITFISALTLVKWRAIWLRAVINLISVLMGIGLLLVAFALWQNRDTATNVAVVLRPGILGSIMLVILQIFYLPNLAIWALGYICGATIHIGASNSISAHSVALKELPAIPLFSATPNSVNTTAYWLIAPIAIVLFLTVIAILRSGRTFPTRNRNALLFTFGLTAIATLLAFFSTGQLLTTELRQVGVDWLPYLLGALAPTLSLFILLLYIPALIRQLRS